MVPRLLVVQLVVGVVVLVSGVADPKLGGHVKMCERCRRGLNRTATNTALSRNFSLVSFLKEKLGTWKARRLERGEARLQTGYTVTGWVTDGQQPWRTGGD